VQASLRELQEETGFAPLRFYNLSRTEAFYQHASDEVALIPVFAASWPPAARRGCRRSTIARSGSRLRRPPGASRGPGAQSTG